MAEVHLGCQNVKKVEEFNHLGQWSRVIWKLRQVSPRELRVGWVKWRQASVEGSFL